MSGKLYYFSVRYWYNRLRSYFADFTHSNEMYMFDLGPWFQVIYIHFFSYITQFIEIEIISLIDLNYLMKSKL